MAKSLDPSSLTEDTPPPDISERLARGAILEALRTTYMPPIRLQHVEFSRLLRFFLSAVVGGAGAHPCPPLNTAGARRRATYEVVLSSPLPRVSVGRGVLEIGPARPRPGGAQRDLVAVQ